MMDSCCIDFGTNDSATSCLHGERSLSFSLLARVLRPKAMMPDTSEWSMLRALTPSHEEPHKPLHVWNATRNTSLATQLEIARNSAERRKGLLGRPSLLPGEGLWIRPCQAIHTGRMNFPIDVVYLDRVKKVLKTASHIPAWRISVCLRAHSVLELPAGTVVQTFTTPGDLLCILHQQPVAALGVMSAVEV